MLGAWRNASRMGIRNGSTRSPMLDERPSTRRLAPPLEKRLTNAIDRDHLKDLEVRG